MTKLERTAIAFIESLCEQAQRSEEHAEKLQRELDATAGKLTSTEHLTEDLHREVRILRVANEEQARRLEIRRDLLDSATRRKRTRSSR